MQIARLHCSEQEERRSGTYQPLAGQTSSAGSDFRVEGRSMPVLPWLWALWPEVPPA